MSEPVDFETALAAKKYPAPLAYDQSIWNAAINEAIEVVRALRLLPTGAAGEPALEAASKEADRLRLEGWQDLAHQTQRNYDELCAALHVIAKERGMTDEKISDAGDDATPLEYVRALAAPTPAREPVAGHPADQEDAEPRQLHPCYSALLTLESFADGSFANARATDSAATDEALNEGLQWLREHFATIRDGWNLTHPPTPEAGTVTEAMVEAAILKSYEPGIKHQPFDAWVRAILTAALAGRRGA